MPAKPVAFENKALILLGSKRKGRLERAYEGFLELPVPVS